MATANSYVEPLLFKWMVSHIQIVGGWATMRFFDKRDAEVLELKRSCPDLPELPHSLQSIKTLFFLL